MAYGRRRTSRRRYSRSRKGALSNYRIATRTSARAQATQIYSLKRRINAIQRRTRPEIQVNYTAGTLVTNSSTTAQSYVWGSSAYIPNLGAAVAETSTSPQNNFARLQSWTGYFTASYSSITATTQPVSFRLLVVQTRATRAEAFQFADLFNFVQGSGADLNNAIANTTALTAFSGPLKEGLARTAKVLCDRKFYLSYQRPQISQRISLRRLLNYYKYHVTNPSEDIGKGAIYAYIIAYTPQSSGAPTYQFNLNAKLAFTDA
nr:MAG: putative capsid protein [Canine stool-associated circular virus]WDW25920.1 MAG: putative capsid protein [Canine stool-associated circular virus]